MCSAIHSFPGNLLESIQVFISYISLRIASIIEFPKSTSSQTRNYLFFQVDYSMSRKVCRWMAVTLEIGMETWISGIQVCACVVVLPSSIPTYSFNFRSFYVACNDLFVSDWYTTFQIQHYSRVLNDTLHLHVKLNVLAVHCTLLPSPYKEWTRPGPHWS